MPRLIDADKLWLTTEYYRGNTHHYYEKFEIDEAPTVDAEPVRHGHWIERHEVCDYILCSVCGTEWCIEDNDTETFNYCPNCGAKMDEVTE